MFNMPVLEKNINEIVLTRIKEWFKKTKIKKAIINISGGADSTYVAYALVKALGKKKVYGILQPNGKQKDINYAKEVVSNLGIDYEIVNIKPIFDKYMRTLMSKNEDLYINLAPRIRMTVAYARANEMKGAVIGTGNASERYIGFFTKFGDGASDFNPISDICKTDLIQAGIDMSIPEKFMKKIPADGLTGKTDEEKYGFSYQVLDTYIKTGICNNNRIKNKIDKMNFNAQHKL